MMMATIVQTTAWVLARPTSNEPPLTLEPKNAGIEAIKKASTMVFIKA